MRTGNEISRIDLNRRPAGPPAAVVGFSEADLVWWSEGDRIEALEQADVDAAASWESSGVDREAAGGPIPRAVLRIAGRRRFLGVACAGLLLTGALLVTAGLSGEAHQVPLSTPIATALPADMPSLVGRPVAPTGDSMPAEVAPPPTAPARHRVRARSKKTPVPAVARHGGGSKSRPARNRP